MSPLCGRPKRQQHKEGPRKTEEDGGVTFQIEKSAPAMPNVRCHGSKITMCSSTSGASMYSEQLVHKHTGPEILSMDNTSSNHNFVTHEAQLQSSFDSLHGAISKLSTLFSQFTVSRGLQTNESLATESSLVAAVAPSTSPATTAYVTPQVFDEMPQQYDFHNLCRKTVSLADGSEHSYYALPEDYSLELATPPMSPLAGENVGVMAPPSAAAPAVGLASVRCSKTNNTAGSETMLIYDMQPPTVVQDDHKVLNEMHISDVFEEEKQESEDLDKCFRKASDNAFSEQLPKYLSKPIFSLEGPTTGAFSFTNEKKSDNKLLAVCFNNTSDNAFSEEAKDFTYLHGLAERFIKLTHKKSTQVVSILCIQEASMHCDDERFEYQLPLRSAPCIWDPGVDLFSYKKMHLFSWIPRSAILVLQKLRKKNTSSMWECLLEKGRQVHWDPGIKIPVYDESDEVDSSWPNEFIAVTKNAMEQKKREDEQSISDLEELNGGENLSVATQYVDPLLKCCSKALKCRAWSEESQVDVNLLWGKSCCHNVTWLYLLWDPGDTKFRDLLATKLQCTDAYTSAMVQILVVQFGASREPVFKSATMRSYAFGLGWTKMNAAAQFVLAVPCSTGTSCSLPCYAIFILQHFLWEFSMKQGTPMTWDPGQATIAMTCEHATTCHRIVCMEMQYCSTTVQVTQQKHAWEFSLMVAKASHQVHYCCLPFILDILYTEPDQQLVCHSRLFSLTEAILRAIYMSNAAILHMMRVLSFGEIAQEGRDAAAVYRVLQIQLPMSKLSHIWDPGIDSLLCVCMLHVHMIQQVGCSAIHASHLVSAFLAPMHIAAYCPSNVKQGTKKNYNAKNLLTSPNYLQILELNIIFITFLPP